MSNFVSNKRLNSVDALFKASLIPESLAYGTVPKSARLGIIKFFAPASTKVVIFSVNPSNTLVGAAILSGVISSSISGKKLIEPALIKKISPSAGASVFKYA